MKTSVMIIAAALITGTVNAQTEVKAEHSSATSVNTEISTKNTKVAGSHKNETSLKTSNGSSANGSAANGSASTGSSTGVTSNGSSSNASSRGASISGQSSAKTEIDASRTVNATRNRAGQSVSIATDKAIEVKDRSANAAVETGTKVEAKTNRVKSNTQAAANASANAAVKTSATGTGAAVKTVKTTGAHVVNTAPKASVNVISSSAISIKR